MDVSASLRRDRVERWDDDAPRDDSARRDARVRETHVRVARTGSRLAMGAPRSVGRGWKWGVCQSDVEKLKKTRQKIKRSKDQKNSFFKKLLIF